MWARRCYAHAPRVPLHLLPWKLPLQQRPVPTGSKHGLFEANAPIEQPAASTRPPIVCVGLNPAYQKSMKFDKLVVDAVNRADAIYSSAGGKGQHCAVAVNLYFPMRRG